MRKRLPIILVLVAVLVAVGVVIARSSTKGPAKQANDQAVASLGSAPGADLAFPDGTRLEQVDNANLGGARALRSTWYGTDATTDDIVAFYDAHLPPLGWSSVTPDRVADPNDPGDPMQVVRQYTSGPYTYRVMVAPLPRRVGGRSIQSGYRHFLITRLSV